MKSIRPGKDPKKYPGLYRGVVLLNDDSPEDYLAYSGRCKIMVQEATGRMRLWRIFRGPTWRA